MARGKVIAHLADCEDGSCPTFFDDTERPGVWIRGELEDGTEGDVFLARTDLDYLLRQLPQ